MIAPHCFRRGGAGRDNSNAGGTTAELTSVDCPITCLTQNGDCLSICHPGGADGQVAYEGGPEYSSWRIGS